MITGLEGLKVYRDEHAPAYRTEDDGTKTPILFWRVGEMIVVPAERWWQFIALMHQLTGRVGDCDCERCRHSRLSSE